jgi:hypothetical protein
MPLRATTRNTAPYLLTAALIVAAGCQGAPRTTDTAAAGDTTTPASEAAPGSTTGSTLRTDRDEYRITRTQDGSIQFTILATYDNRASEPASIAACRTPNPPTIQKRVGDDWTAVYNPPVLACISEPTVIEPGEQFRYEYQVSAFPRGGNSYPQFEADSVPGVYRLLWIIHEGTRDPTGSRGSEEGQRVISNEFRLVE